MSRVSFNEDQGLIRKSDVRQPEKVEERLSQEKY